MPIEIRELVIRTAISEDAAPPGDDLITGEISQAAIVAACVDQVLAVLRARSER